MCFLGLWAPQWPRWPCSGTSKYYYSQAWSLIHSRKDKEKSEGVSYDTGALDLKSQELGPSSGLVRACGVGWMSSNAL